MALNQSIPSTIPTTLMERVAYIEQQMMKIENEIKYLQITLRDLDHQMFDMLKNLNTMRYTDLSNPNYGGSI